MEIKYLGHSSFLIKTKTAKLVTDPFDPALVGLRFPKVEADIITVSHNHKDHNQTQLVGGSPLVIGLPGEYEKNGMRIFGYSSFHDGQGGSERGTNTLYKIEAEGVSVLHCGDLGVVLEDSVVDTIGAVDVLLVPVGGFYTIDPSQAAQLVRKFEPSLVIPMHYNQPKLKQENFGKLSTVDEFFKKLGLSMPQPLPKLVIKGGELEDEMKVILLQN